MKTVILTTSLVGPRNSYGPGDPYQAASEAEAKRMVEAGQAEWPKEDQTAALEKAREGEVQAKAEAAAAKAEAQQLRDELEKLKAEPAKKTTPAKTTAKPKEDGAK
ncbi:hypothetical protein PN39_05505 [Vibrio anguillarum]|uniref:hypothetical protein n=1 Tax=Vibrio anguillarum TaxID=55601 RepID=UPI001C041EB0|nr:hypothetical protein [Vibrio anguillarum]MBT2925331.1 hypothetical protein [Vibrio anguillarum]